MDFFCLLPAIAHDFFFLFSDRRQRLFCNWITLFPDCRPGLLPKQERIAACRFSVLSKSTQDRFPEKTMEGISATHYCRSPWLFCQAGSLPVIKFWHRWGTTTQQDGNEPYLAPYTLCQILLKEQSRLFSVFSDEYAFLKSTSEKQKPAFWRFRTVFLMTCPLANPTCKRYLAITFDAGHFHHFGF